MNNFDGNTNSLYQTFYRLILFRPFGFIAPKHFKIIWLSNLSTVSVPDEGYSRFWYLRSYYYWCCSYSKVQYTTRCVKKL